MLRDDEKIINDKKKSVQRFNDYITLTITLMLLNGPVALNLKK